MKPVVVLLIAIGVGALAFYGGMQYQLNKQATGTGRNFASGQQGMGRTGVGTGVRRTGNGQPISGEIINVDTDSLTVKLTDGSSRIILLNDKTIYNKTASVEKTELKAGEKVGIFGTTNTDGSVSAQNVQLNPQFRMGGVGANASGSAR
ncbi:MAG: hypothetical protein NTV98_04375 [Candidatus Roizmanbacteria bacterium]|nr:hypothetical protein [Candidatus Roizmanbacteria bacterium]